MYRIGIDVGGTNTDAVIMQGRHVVGAVKRLTTPDVTSGITAALAGVLADTGVPHDQIRAVMLGTTQFVNAVLQRRELENVAILRLGGPVTSSLPPMVDWPAELRHAVDGPISMIAGGVEYDGQLIEPLDEARIRQAACTARSLGIRAVAVSAVFSPVNPAQELRAGTILREELPDISISLSHELGRMGLLERENATILNASLRSLGARTVAGFGAALARMGLHCPLYVAQNDGTLMNAERAAQAPVYTFTSGPTNSMRGAAFLSGLRDAVVIDIGGTSTDIGLLVQGFPREAAVDVEIGGVRTNLRLPDVLSLGLGGGSLVIQTGADVTVGPLSVGYELGTRARVCGGTELTATDIAVAAGRIHIGDSERVRELDPMLVHQAMERMHRMVEDALDRVKPSRAPIPVVLVGGGSALVGDHLAGASKVVRPAHAAVANAVGAAMAQIAGEVDRVVSMRDIGRSQALAHARREAMDRAVAAGADPDTVEVVQVEEVPLAYLPNQATRVRVKAVGEARI